VTKQLVFEHLSILWLMQKYETDLNRS